MIDVNNKPERPASCALTLLLAACLAWGATRGTSACTTVMVGRRASEDLSVLMASSCDGDVMGLMYVMPGRTGERLPRRARRS